MNYSNECVYRGLIDLEPNAEEIVAAAEHQELQKRRQAAKFLVKLSRTVLDRNHEHIHRVLGRIPSAAKETTETRYHGTVR